MQDLLTAAALRSRTHEENLCVALKSMIEPRNIEMKSVIALTTDGATAILGRYGGLVGRLLKDDPYLITHPCIIHQAVPCASMQSGR